MSRPECHDSDDDKDKAACSSEVQEYGLLLTVIGNDSVTCRSEV